MRWPIAKSREGPGSIVPPGGLSTSLITLTAGVMTFLAAVAVTLAFSAGRLAEGWARDLAGTGTVRISVPADQLEVQTQAAMTVLRTTPGIRDVRIVDASEQAELLEPWLGGDFALDTLNLPRLLAVEFDDNPPDLDGLRLRLAGEAPGATLDDHARWRRPIEAAARRVARVAWTAAGLTAVALVALVVLSAQAALLVNAREIATLRLIGARDQFISRAFVARITGLALVGSVLGLIPGLLLIFMQVTRDDLLPAPAIVPRGAQWLGVLLLPVAVALVTYLAARITARRTLRKMN